MYIQRYPGLLTPELCADLVTRVTDNLQSTHWRTDNPFMPLRLAKYISVFPSLGGRILREFKHLRIDQDGTIYFGRYPTGTQCLPHVDPENLTLIVELQSAGAGGRLLIEGEDQNLSVGDAVLFRGEYMHQVTEVTEGERLSVSVWFK